MTPQEYIDRERRRAYTNLKRANERRDEKAAERLAEKLEVLKEIENGLETVAWRRAQACHMKISQKTVDAIRAEYMPYDRKRGARALAEKYGLSENYVWLIVTNKARKTRRAN